MLLSGLVGLIYPTLEYSCLARRSPGRSGIYKIEVRGTSLVQVMHQAPPDPGIYRYTIDFRTPETTWNLSAATKVPPEKCREAIGVTLHSAPHPALISGELRG